MQIEIEPGSYVAAVSGGVDSMALLHLLSEKPGLKLTVAHFDHGIREDSQLDRQLVQDAAKNYHLPFVYDEGDLSAGASEEKARTARYKFLRCAKQSAGARAIITAHHQDDMVETAVINLLRGTGRRGLSSLKSTGEIIRPLLNATKEELIKYARDNQLKWRDDPTNQDVRYLRNYVRTNFVPRFSAGQRQQLIDIINNAYELNTRIDEQLISQLHLQPALSQLDRHWFIMLPHPVSLEIMAEWLRRASVKDVTKKLLEKIVAQTKTLKPGKQIDVGIDKIIIVGEDILALSGRER